MRTLTEFNSLLSQVICGHLNSLFGRSGMATQKPSRPGYISSLAAILFSGAKLFVPFW